LPVKIHRMPIWVEIIAWVSRLILVLLFGLSVWSLAIIWDRRRVFQSAALELRAKLRSRLEKEKNVAVVEAVFKVQLSQDRVVLEKGLTALASLGSNAPYIGLFGTVLGIIQAFGALSTNASGNMNLVMFLIAEALVATAVGLFVAIPALLAFNGFNKKLRVTLAELEAEKDLFVADLERRRHAT
jgi:biopolymer transport protein ExbB